MRKPIEGTVMHSYPGMIALVTSYNEGKYNIMAAGWHSYISMDPPIYGVAIGNERYTHKLVNESASFAVNFLPYEKAASIQGTGSISGIAHDKFEPLGLPFEKGITIPAPILVDAYVAYECKVIDRNTYGDHDWFVGEITQCYRDDTKFLDNGLPNLKEIDIPLYLGRSSYSKIDNKSEIETFFKKNV
ncbi:flavin reductase family protein [Oceanobacillus manasiensis]|uniref:flavin reductase family protein n=1 Tax=Oceanobacillus manasiensis TaxID=586413 RepID=UPI0005AA4FB4|nr:flavin reductase family protein [Oceanobacillus manasiensis]